MVFRSSILCFMVCLCVCAHVYVSVFQDNGSGGRKFPIEDRAVLIMHLMIAVKCVFVSAVRLGEVEGQKPHFVLNRIRLQSVHVLIRGTGNAERPIRGHGVLFRYLGVAGWEFILSVC